MARLLLLLADRAEAGLELGEVILAGWDLRAPGRMDTDIGLVGEVLEVEVLDRLLELECQVVNGGEESGFLKGHQVEAVVIQEASGEEGEEGTKIIDTNY